MVIKILLLISLNFLDAAVQDDFVETLENTYLVQNQSNIGVTKIIVDQENKKIKVWESCVPKDCDWGVINYKQSGNNLIAWYGMGDIKKQVVLNFKEQQLMMEAEIKYFVDQKLTKTVNYQLKSQKYRLK